MHCHFWSCYRRTMSGGWITSCWYHAIHGIIGDKTSIINCPACNVIFDHRFNLCNIWRWSWLTIFLFAISIAILHRKQFANRKISLASPILIWWLHIICNHVISFRVGLYWSNILFFTIKLSKCWLWANRTFTRNILVSLWILSFMSNNLLDFVFCCCTADVLTYTHWFC